jgi:glycine cleavage system H protein
MDGWLREKGKIPPVDSRVVRFDTERGDIMGVYHGYDMPDDLYYHGDHAWVRNEGDGTVTVGMNEFYGKTAGDTTYIDLPFEGDDVEAGETCGKIQSAKWVGKFVAPLSGEVLEVNEDLEDDPTLINTDPYGDGWIMKLEVADEDELASLVTGGAIEAWLKKEIDEAEAQK